MWHTGQCMGMQCVVLSGIGQQELMKSGIPGPQCRCRCNLKFTPGGFDNKFYRPFYQGFFFFFFFFFCVPQLYLWGSPLLGEIFACVTVFFFNPTIKVVTFRLRGWCVLGVFLLPAFTRLGHERQDLLSPCDEMHVCTD